MTHRDRSGAARVRAWRRCMPASGVHRADAFAANWRLGHEDSRRGCVGHEAPLSSSTTERLPGQQSAASFLASSAVRARTRPSSRGAVSTPVVMAPLPTTVSGGRLGASVTTYVSIPPQNPTCRTAGAIFDIAIWYSSTVSCAVPCMVITFTNFMVQPILTAGHAIGWSVRQRFA